MDHPTSDQTQLGDGTPPRSQARPLERSAVGFSFGLLFGHVMISVSELILVALLFVRFREIAHLFPFSTIQIASIGGDILVSAAATIVVIAITYMSWEAIRRLVSLGTRASAMLRAVTGALWLLNAAQITVEWLLLFDMALHASGHDHHDVKLAAAFLSTLLVVGHQLCAWFNVWNVVAGIFIRKRLRPGE